MPKRILVVDDSPEILELLRDLLTDEGYFVIARLESLQELDEVRRADPNLIILDHLHKGIDSSQDILALMKQSVDLSGVPVIICTALSHAATVLKEQLGPVNVELILKPFDIDELLATVKRMIEQAEARTKANNPPYAAVVVNLHDGGSEWQAEWVAASCIPKTSQLARACRMRCMVGSYTNL